MKASDNTNQLMNSIAFKFWKVFYGASEPQPRWRFCVNKVANTLGFAVGALYVERAFDEHAKKEVRFGFITGNFDNNKKKNYFFKGD